MTCEICDTQPATMWVEAPKYPLQLERGHYLLSEPIPSCDDCGPQLGYKILAPLTPTTSD